MRVTLQLKVALQILQMLPAFKVAATRVAQTGTAAQRIARELGTAPSVDLEGRQAITGTVPQGDAAQIGGVPTLEAATRQAVTGEARSVGAADMLAVVANVPKAVSAALSEDPAKVEAAIDRGECSRAYSRCSRPTRRSSCIYTNGTAFSRHGRR
jgi:hypothetical protein